MRDEMGNEVYDILSSLSNITQLGICFYDLNHFFACNYGKIEIGFTGHYCEFCRAVRDLPGGREACIKNDVYKVRKLAESYKKPFFNVCHAGLCEYIVPILKSDELIGIVFIGQSRIEDETTFDNIYSNISKYYADKGEFFPIFNRLNLSTREELSSAGKLAEYAFASLTMSEGISIKKDFSTISLAKDYIDANYMNNIGLAKIAVTLNINPSYLSRKFKEKCGTSISSYISDTRIDQAKKLLIHSNLPVINVALNVGFSDQNYFSRMFKKAVGLPPQKFRQLNTKE